MSIRNQTMVGGDLCWWVSYDGTVRPVLWLGWLSGRRRVARIEVLGEAHYTDVSAAYLHRDRRDAVNHAAGLAQWAQAKGELAELLDELDAGEQPPQ